MLLKYNLLVTLSYESMSKSTDCRSGGTDTFYGRTHSYNNWLFSDRHEDEEIKHLDLGIHLEMHIVFGEKSTVHHQFLHFFAVLHDFVWFPLVDYEP